MSDKNKLPRRINWIFFVAIPFVLGLIVNLIQAFIWLMNTPAELRNFEAFPRGVIYTFGICIIIISLIGVIYWYFSRQLKKTVENQRKRIALFVPRSRSREALGAMTEDVSGIPPYAARETFWMEFETRVRDHLAAKHYDVETVTLTREYNEDQQVELLSGFDWAGVVGAIVAPAGDKVIPKVIELTKSGNIIVLHDAAPERTMRFFAEADVSAKIVCVDNRKGGELAAEIMHAYLKQHSNKQAGYDILIVPGNKHHAHSELRVTAFQRRMGELTNNDVSWYVTEDGNWNYDKARDCFSAFVSKNTIINSNARHVTGIFVCNDEMAEAVEDTIVDSIAPSGFSNAKIVGFDHTLSLQSEFYKKKNYRIIGTVDAKVDEQAKKAVDFICDLVEGKPRRGSTELVQPTKVTA